jgi:hypothetical protein
MGLKTCLEIERKEKWKGTEKSHPKKREYYR